MQFMEINKFNNALGQEIVFFLASCKFEHAITSREGLVHTILYFTQVITESE